MFKQSKHLQMIIAIICWFLFFVVFKSLIDEWRQDKISWVKKTSYREVVQEVINYSYPHLKARRIRKLPHFTISYHKHKTFQGVFNGTIVIYIKTIDDIPSLIEVVLHEVMHFIQSESDKNFHLYDYYTKQVGYRKNPFEIESRKFAADNLNQCIEYLESKKMIKKQFNKF